MTKAELIAAIAAAPDDTRVYLDFDGLLRTLAVVEACDNDGAGGDWVICFEPPEGVIQEREEEEEEEEVDPGLLAECRRLLVEGE